MSFIARIPALAPFGVRSFRVQWPSDTTMRNLLVGETMPTELLMRAMGVSRTPADSARAVGALSGAGLVAALGPGARISRCARSIS